MNQTYKAINLQYALPPTRPTWGGQGGVGSYYAAWICRFVSVDPLQFKYPELTPFQYASNRCITGIDLDGAEYYVKDDGSITQGKDPNDKDVYIEQQKVVPVYNFQIPNDSPAKQVGLPTRTYEEPITFEIKTIYTKLSVNYDLLIAFASVVNKESLGNKEESFAIANTMMNYIKEGGNDSIKTLEDMVLYENSYVYGAKQAFYTEFKSMTQIEQNKKYAISAVINAIAYFDNIKGYYDYSSGANTFDGRDLVLSQYGNLHRGYSWSSDSKELLLKFKKEIVKGDIDVESWKYKDNNYGISTIKIAGETIFTKLHTPKGEGKAKNAKKFR